MGDTVLKWIPYALGTAVFLAVADVCLKLAAGKLSNSLGLFFYGSITFLTGLGWVLLDKSRGVAFHAQPTGILAAMGVGVAFSVVTIGLYLTFGAGAPISLASPLVRICGLLLASLVGLIFWHEPLTWRYVIGMILTVGGLYMLITR